MSPPLSVVALVTGAFLCAGAAQAHLPSTAELVLSVEGTRVTGHWNVALRDLDYALGLDDNHDGKLTWGEIKSHADAITRYCQTRIVLRAGATLIPVQWSGIQLDRRSDGVYAVLALVAGLPAAAPGWRIDYDALFDLDPLHRGILRLSAGSHSVATIFSPDERSYRAP